jgi:hypothetical protein
MTSPHHHGAVTTMAKVNGVVIQLQLPGHTGVIHQHAAAAPGAALLLALQLGAHLGCGPHRPCLAHQGSGNQGQQRRARNPEQPCRCHRPSPQLTPP